MKGKFIVLEGSDGSGKSSVLQALKSSFKDKKIDIHFSREPGGTPVAEKIRGILLDNNNEGMSYRCEALLYAASRADHCENLIRPKIEAGENVLSERFTLSSLAYQGWGRGLGIEDVAGINEFATAGLQPDLVLFLDVDPIKVLERKAARTDKDRLENGGDQFFDRVYEGYKKALAYMPNYVAIDASQPLDKVVEDCWQEIMKLLED